MELTHYLNSTIIDEPIGFDSLKMTMKRGDYHGMSAEVSEQTLEFYGTAADMIARAYEQDIDTELKYVVKSGSTEIYSGVLDLSTYEEQRSQYRSVSCKVGEVGVKTLFNNRVDTEIDLNTSKTVDGADLSVVPEWKEIAIPRKSLLYTNKLETEKEDSFGISNPSYAGTWSTGNNITFSASSVNEFGVVNSDGYIFKEGDGFDEQYGNDTTMSVSINIKVRLDTLSVVYYGEGAVTGFRIVLMSGTTAIRAVNFSSVAVGATATLVYTGSVSTQDGLRIVMQAYRSIDAAVWSVSASVQPSSYCTMKMYDNLTSDVVRADMLLVESALDKAIRCISENGLSLASTWYNWSGVLTAIINSSSGGAAKALTNGYKIRGLFGDTRPMTTSFKELIESLDSMDCIGWGFSQEDGEEKVRVERWDWFYKSTLLASFSNASEVKRTVDDSMIFTELNIGYKKYDAEEQFNSIDSVHSERTFVSGIKAVSKKLSKLSAFIADNYAIEETCRASFQVDESESFKYDENIFVFELKKSAAGTTVSRGITNATGIGRPEEVINARLSPRQCAARWRSYLFAANSDKGMMFSTGTVNVSASFGTSSTGTSLSAQAESNPMAENADITYTPSIFRAETVSFTYPLSIAQYNAIKANPYGLIEVNGIQGWIKEFSYTFNTGEAEFKLIPKR